MREAGLTAAGVAFELGFNRLPVFAAEPKRKLAGIEFEQRDVSFATAQELFVRLTETEQKLPPRSFILPQKELRPWIGYIIDEYHGMGVTRNTHRPEKIAYADLGSDMVIGVSSCAYDAILINKGFIDPTSPRYGSPMIFDTLYHETVHEGIKFCTQNVFNVPVKELIIRKTKSETSAEVLSKEGMAQTTLRNKSVETLYGFITGMRSIAADAYFYKGFESRDQLLQIVATFNSLYGDPDITAGVATYLQQILAQGEDYVANYRRVLLAYGYAPLTVIKNALFNDQVASFSLSRGTPDTITTGALKISGTIGLLDQLDHYVANVDKLKQFHPKA
jgi:hypothetical protein